MQGRAEASQVAGVIHIDFEKGRRARPKARIESKEYVIQDGDVAEFRFNN